MIAAGRDGPDPADPTRSHTSPGAISAVVAAVAVFLVIGVLILCLGIVLLARSPRVSGPRGTHEAPAPPGTGASCGLVGAAAQTALERACWIFVIASLSRAEVSSAAAATSRALWITVSR